MAASIRNSLAGTIGSLLLAALSATAGAADLVHPNPNDEFNWDAKVVTSDFRTDTLEISGDVRVTQGPMSIEAGAAKANGVRSQNSRWTFETAVHIVTSEAERRAWATVNAETGGGKKSGSGRGKAENHAPSRKGGHRGGAASAGRTAAERSASAKKAAATRKRNAEKSH